MKKMMQLFFEGFYKGAKMLCGYMWLRREC